MPQDSDAVWIKYRKQLILEIEDAQREIKETLGIVSAKLNGRIKDADFTRAIDIQRIKDHATLTYNAAATRITHIVETKTESTANLARKAGIETDQMVFKVASPLLGTGDPKAATILKKRRYASGFKLSDNLWPSDKKVLAQFQQTVENGLKSGEAIDKTVKALAKLKVEHAPDKLPKYLKQLEKAAKQAAQGMPKSKKSFNKIVAQVKAQLAKRKANEYRTRGRALGILGTRNSTEVFVSRLRKAVNQGSQTLVSEAVNEHLVKRAEYHSMRAARTMTARSFHLQGQQDRKKRAWVIGERWNLSASHPRFDECDLRAGIDLGLGAGVYPKGAAPFDHINGLCWLSDVIDEDYFERDEPLKPKWNKGYKKKIAEISPGSDLSKMANKLGNRKTNLKVPSDSKPKSFSFDEVKAELAKQATSEKKTPLYKVKKSQANKSVSSPESRRPSSFVRSSAQREQQAIDTQKELQQAAKSAAEAEKLFKQQQKDYFNAQQASRLSSGKLKEAVDERAKIKAATMAALEKDVAKAKAKLAALKVKQANLVPKSKRPKVPEALDILDAKTFKQIGPQSGSNPGGLFKDASGESWYLKYPPSDQHARNEVMAAHLYRLSGIAKVPEVRLIRHADGRLGVASKIINGLKSDAAKLRAGKIKGVHEGFAVDAWLANWDVVGLGYDNMLVRGGYAYRIDTGGALLFRAQGTAKGKAFGKIVEEWDSFRTVESFTTTPVFRSITEKKLIASGNRVLRISDNDIRKMVALYELDDDLAETLIARKRWISAEVKRLKAKHPKPLTIAKANTPDGRITSEEWERITESRANGYAIGIDKDEIEDQQILFWREQSKEGGWLTNATFKVRGNGKQGLERLLRESQKLGGGEEHDDFYESLVSMVKSARFRINQGKSVSQWEAKVATKYTELLSQAKSLDSIKRKHYAPWLGELKRLMTKSKTLSPSWKGPSGFVDVFVRPMKKGKANAIHFVRKKGIYQKKALDRGRLRRANGTIFDELTTPKKDGYKYFYEAKLEDGTRIRYWPDEEGMAFAYRNKVEFSLPGGETESASRAFTLLDELGIVSSRATSLDIEDIYLNQIAYAAFPKKYSDLTKAIQGKKSDERIAISKRWLSQHLGVDDVAKLPDYNPAGSREAFGHGRINRESPHLVGPKWDSFKKRHILYHKNTDKAPIADVVDSLLHSGGAFSSTQDRMRRGIKWLRTMSPEADLESGGASYVFTRIRKRGYRGTGFYWEPDHIKRLDAISYSQDLFGRTTGSTVVDNRKSMIEEWEVNSKTATNEVVFKDSLSLFDQLIKIVTQSQAERKQVISVFKKHGYAVFPDGRKIEDIVK